METAELGSQTVELASLIRRATDESYLALKELVEKSKKGEENGQAQSSDSEKKIDLLKFVARTRQRMLRLHVLAKWCQQVPLVDYCKQLSSTLSIHETCFTQTADSLFFVHDSLQQARAPIFDVPSAIEVFLTGGYNRLPNCIDDLGIQNTLPESDQKPALKKLNTFVRSKLLEVSIPKEVSNISVSDGIATLKVDGEFKVLLTLGYRGHLHLWRILHLELLVGEKNGPIKLEESRQFALGDDIERRMAVSDNPFSILYTILHELSVALLMDTVIRQAQLLRHGRWRDAIRFELISDSHLGQSSSNTAVMQLGQDGELDSTGLRIPGLKITYWLDMDKSSMVGTSTSTESESSPFVKIEPVQDLHVKCVHSSFILDPLTDKEASLKIDQTCIDVEKLLLRAIACNRHTRLLEIQRELSRNAQICRASGDVVLKHEGLRVDTDRQKKEDKLSTEDYYRDEVLQVRAYGNSYITLGVNIRTGHFLLQSSKNILPQSAISESEEALNKGTITATDAFISLRSKSILHLFANTGKFLGLKVYDPNLNTITLPKSEILGSDISIMGFPQCGNTYYLSVQLDKDFKPVFHLLETLNPDGKQVTRCNKIDIGQTQTDSNEQTNSQTDNLQTPSGSRSAFTSIVDEVFEKTNPQTSSFSSQNSFSSPSFSHLEGGLQNSSSGYLQNSVLSNNFAASSSVRSSLARKTVPSKSESDIRQSSTQPQHTMDYANLPSTSGHESTPNEKTARKRSVSELLLHIPSLQGLKSNQQESKRRKLTEPVNSHHSASQPLPSVLTTKTSNSIYASLLSSKNQGISANIYCSILLHVIKHCSLSIKHAQLTIQMDSLDISYVEEVGLRSLSSNLWLRLPFAKDEAWKHICLRLGKSGSMNWDVKINDSHFIELKELNNGSLNTHWGEGVRFANMSETDSHISFDSDGVLLAYNTVESNSVKNLESDLRRILNARSFARDMRLLIGSKPDFEEGKEGKEQQNGEFCERFSEVRKAFKIEAVGLVSLWFSFGSMPSVHFVVEWEAGKDGCTMHVSPDQLWPHTKFLEDFVNGGEVSSFLDCIRLTAGPLLSLSGAIRPARMPVTVSSSQTLNPKPPNPNTNTPNPNPNPNSPFISHLTSHNPQTTAMLSIASQSHPNTNPNIPNPSPNLPNPNPSPNPNFISLAVGGRERPGIVPSSLLPFDVSVVLRGPYWIRIIYRKKFAVDMRCFAGDQVWLQPATPPKGGPTAGGSLPCPQFRPFIMEHVAQGLSALEPNFPSNPHPNPTQTHPLNTTNRLNSPPGSLSRLGTSNTGTAAQLVPNAVTRAAASAAVLAASTGLAGGISAVRLAQAGLPVQMKGELNTAFIGLGDDGGYGGGWVPLAALKKVLRGILKYLGVLWLFAQLPELLKEILGSILKENEGALLNLDQEQPALRFYVGGYVFAVSVHRVQLLLQVLSVKRFHHQQQLAQNGSHQNPNSQEELSASEINEICEYFSRRVASEPYDASRVASFITLLTLPISSLREFLKLISWKKGLLQQAAHVGEIAPAQRGRIELCLENHSGYASSDSGPVSKSNIHHDRAHNLVDFALTFVLDPAHIPHMNVAGGAAWLPYCVSVRLRYNFSETGHNNHNNSLNNNNLNGNHHVITFLGMEGSHGGKACWLQSEDWEKCKQRVARAVECVNVGSIGDLNQGRLKLVAENVQKALQTSLQQMRDGPISAGSTAN